ncbi:MAG: hypothetical protein ACOYON_06705 [Fimbriimonas sp.]
MFKVTNGSLGASIAEVAYGPPPYGTLIWETQGGTSRTLLRGDAPFRFWWMSGSAIPLFRGGN